MRTKVRERDHTEAPHTNQPSLYWSWLEGQQNYVLKYIMAILEALEAAAMSEPQIDEFNRLFTPETINQRIKGFEHNHTLCEPEQSFGHFILGLVKEFKDARRAKVKADFKALWLCKMTDANATRLYLARQARLRS